MLAFSLPDEAVKALADAEKGGNVDAIVRIFGPGSQDWILSGDAAQDARARQRFVTAFEQTSAIEMQGNDKAVLSVGDDGSRFRSPWSTKRAAGPSTRRSARKSC